MVLLKSKVVVVETVYGCMFSTRPSHLSSGTASPDIMNCGKTMCNPEHTVVTELTVVTESVMISISTTETKATNEAVI